MRVLVAGASGVLGRALVPLLAAAGHEVVGMARSEAGARRVADLGGEPVVCDALDADAVAAAVREARPDAIVNQLTAIPAAIRPRRVARQFAATNRLRAEGTANLIRAGEPLGVRHVAESNAFSYDPAGERRVKHEDDPLNLRAPRTFRPNVAAIAALERQTLDAGGVVLRYGHLYGPGTVYARDGSTTAAVRARRLPVVGGGRGLFSFVHVRDAASATVAALALDGPRVLNVVDDEPAPSAEWIAELARLAGAPPPRRVPAAVAALAAGRWGVEWMDRLAGASNERARRELGWEPEHRHWRAGFAADLGEEA